MLSLLLLWHWLSEKVIGRLKIKGGNPQRFSTVTYVRHRVEQKQHMDMLIKTKISDWSKHRHNKTQMFDYITPTMQAYSVVGAKICLRQIMSTDSDDWILTSTWLLQAKASLGLLTHLSGTSDGHLTSDWPMQPWFHILRSLGCVRVYITGNNFTYLKLQHVRGHLCCWSNASAQSIQLIRLPVRWFQKQNPDLGFCKNALCFFMLLGWWGFRFGSF